MSIPASLLPVRPSRTSGLLHLLLLALKTDRTMRILWLAYALAIAVLLARPVFAAEVPTDQTVDLGCPVSMERAGRSPGCVAPHTQVRAKVAFSGSARR